MGEFKMTFSNYDDVIDSRDVIARIEELEDTLQSAYDEFADRISWKNWLKDETNHDDIEEFNILSELARECSDYASDWDYGETLIRRSYFEPYMDEMVEDCYTLPKDMPYWMSITLDYDALEQDYTSVDYDGVEYLIRSV